MRQKQNQCKNEHERLHQLLQCSCNDIQMGGVQLKDEGIVHGVLKPTTSVIKTSTEMLFTTKRLIHVSSYV